MPNITNVPFEMVIMYFEEGNLSQITNNSIVEMIAFATNNKYEFPNSLLFILQCPFSSGRIKNSRVNGMRYMV